MGSTAASLCTTISATRTSMAPVGSLGFTVAPSRPTTWPVTVITLSGRAASATANGALPAGKTSWVMPKWSRKSMNSSPPWSRLLCTQPDSRTWVPASVARSAPQVWVR